jgi:hypothetical protein
MLPIKDPQAELLCWHYQLGHASFKLILLLTALEVLPHHLAEAQVPRCAGCMYGTMSMRPWGTKAKQNKGKLKAVKTAGQSVSVDQLESRLPGFIPQLKGKLIQDRYKAATVFIDH